MHRILQLLQPLILSTLDNRDLLLILTLLTLRDILYEPVRTGLPLLAILVRVRLLVLVPFLRRFFLTLFLFLVGLFLLLVTVDLLLGLRRVAVAPVTVEKAGHGVYVICYPVSTLVRFTSFFLAWTES